MHYKQSLFKSQSYGLNDFSYVDSYMHAVKQMVGQPKVKRTQ